jgi:glycosyltransferase involved in cell wall biosynthesis
MSTLRIAISVSTRHAYSETFIAAHEQRLKEVVAILSDGMPPRRVDDVPLLLPTTLSARVRSFVERKVQNLDQVSQRHRRTVELLRDRRVDVVLAEYGVMGEAMVDACRDAGVPLVAHFHGYDAHMHQVATDHDNYRRLFASAAALVVVSRSMEQRLLDLGAPRAKVHYNCYGIDVERFTAGQPEDAPAHFTAIGRFVDKKAPQLTLLAFRRVVDQCPDARLTMVGDGPLREACAQMIVALGLQAQVDLCGVRSPVEVAALLHGSRAFVQHSVVTAAGDSEGTPLAVLEAMACGVPVVATRHAGIGDVVEHGVRGLLCDERDVNTMADHLVALVRDPALAGALGRAGRSHVEQHHRVEDRIAALHGILSMAANKPT